MVKRYPVSSPDQIDMDVVRSVLAATAASVAPALTKCFEDCIWIRSWVLAQPS
jgi:hypothetical protein